jgi:Putative addiction module component
MPRKLEDVAEEALELKLDDRAALAEKLLRSLEGISEAENERLWLAEAERRLLEIQSGQVETLPGEEVLRRAAAERATRPDSALLRAAYRLPPSGR